MQSVYDAFNFAADLDADTIARGARAVCEWSYLFLLLGAC